jgi:hypothetical protein
MTYIPSLGGRLKLGAGWCNTPSPVLRGAGNESLYDRDIVAPPGNQAATEKTNVCLTGDENPAYSPTTEFRTDFRGQFTQFGSPSPNGWPVQRSCSRVLGPGLVRKHQPRDSNLGSPASRDSRRPRRPIRRSTGPVALGDGAPHPGAPPMPRTPREAGASPVWVAKLELRDERRRTQSPASGPQIRTPDQDRQPLSAEDSPGWPRPVRETRVRQTGGE